MHCLDHRGGDSLGGYGGDEVKPTTAIVQQVLSVAEQRKLQQCEEEIQQGGDMIINALKVIHDDKLYREEFKTFGEYVKERVGKSRQWAYQQLAHVEVVANIAKQSEEMSTIADKMKESATRELSGLDAQTQSEVVKKASANGSKAPKAKDIKQARQSIEKPKVHRADAPLPEAYVDADGEPVPQGLLPVWRLGTGLGKLVNDARSLKFEIGKLNDSEMSSQFTLAAFEHIQDVIDELELSRPCKVLDGSWLAEGDVNE